MTKLPLQEAISKLAKQSLANSRVFTKYEQTEAIQCRCKTAFGFPLSLSELFLESKKKENSNDFCGVRSNKNEPEGEIMCLQVVD